MFSCKQAYVWCFSFFSAYKLAYELPNTHTHTLLVPWFVQLFAAGFVPLHVGKAVLQASHANHSDHMISDAVHDAHVIDVIRTLGLDAAGGHHEMLLGPESDACSDRIIQWIKSRQLPRPKL
jgi:hypothetical protein